SPTAGSHSPVPCHPWRSARAFRDAPGTNLTVVDAAMVIASAVCGLRPDRCARSDLLKLPKPGKATSPPLASSPDTILMRASRLLDAATWDWSVAAARDCTSSALFI